MRALAYAVLVEPLVAEDGGGFSAVVPDRSGGMSDGDTPEAALANVQAASKAWLATARDMGRAIPEPSRSRLTA